MKNRQKRLLFVSVVLPALTLVALLATPVAASTDEEGCYYGDEYTDHGACGSTNCWFWEPGVRCNDGAWQGGCNCTPIMN